MAILALPPLLPAIKRQFHLSEAALSTLADLPILLLALGAVAGSAAVARLGARRALGVGLVVVGLASALRGEGGIAGLFSASIALGAGVAVLQPAMPSVTRAWFPSTAGFATSVYSNGIIVGEAAAASLTLPLVLPLLGSWRWALAFWGAPALVAAGLLLAPFAKLGSTECGERLRSRERLRWWPSWGDGVIWRIGLVQGGGSVVYFGANAFVPTTLHALGHPSLVAPCLAALNTSQLSASAVVAVLSRRGARPHWPLGVSGAAALAGLTAFLADPASLAIAGCALAGIASAVCFVIALALPPLVAAPSEVHRVAAGALTIGYTAAFLFPLAGGLAWDATGKVALALLPAALGAVVLGTTLVWPGATGKRLAGLELR
jgi:CP family cyanate transporter-like MFS transporter